MAVKFELWLELDWLGEMCKGKTLLVIEICSKLVHDEMYLKFSKLEEFSEKKLFLRPSTHVKLNVKNRYFEYFV